MRAISRLLAASALSGAVLAPGGTAALAASVPAAQPAASPADLAAMAPHNLADALALAYATNPQLQAERAKLRATDENVPSALAGWRPQVSMSAGFGTAAGRQEVATFGGNVDAQKLNRKPQGNYQLQATEYLYRGGRTEATTHEAENLVRSERARLIAQEQQVFSDTVTAYVQVVQNTQLLAINKANEAVLGGQLKAINARFRVGELTTTDVAQAQSALAQAIAQRQTAEGNLAAARATFERTVGVMPPANLAAPPALNAPAATAEAAAAMAVANNPNVIAAKFAEAQAKDAIDVAFAALAPTVSLQGTASDSHYPNLSYQRVYQFSGTINLTVPIYQGGQEYAAVRQARQSYQQAVHTREDAERAAREQAVQAYETLVAARAAIESSKVNVKASEIALEGVEREALVGSATTQNVLIEQQNLLTAQTNLVQNVASMINASYTLTGAIGRLTARDLALNVPLYDDTAYYNAVRHRLWGTGDYATDQPGR